MCPLTACAHIVGSGAGFVESFSIGQRVTRSTVTILPMSDLDWRHKIGKFDRLSYQPRTIGITRRANWSAIFARVPCARKPTITARFDRWHNWQLAHVTLSRVCAGQTTIDRPAGVCVFSGVSIGTMQTTGPAPVSANWSACPALSADKLTVNPQSLACRIHCRLCGAVLWV